MLNPRAIATHSRTDRQIVDHHALRIGFARFRDHRGFFTEHFRESDVAGDERLAGLRGVRFSQTNESFSRTGTIRGMHFQWNPFMGKLVRTVFGRMVDLVLDIRKGSPTFGRMIAYDMPSRLEDDSAAWIWVPPGFAIEQEQGPDFEVYRVMKEDVQYVGIYSGFAPSFPFERSDAAQEETRMETPSVFVVSRWDGDRLVDREMLFTVRPEGGPGASLHVWTAVSDPAELRLAEKITSTIVAVSAAPCGVTKPTSALVAIRRYATSMWPSAATIG